MTPETVFSDIELDLGKYLDIDDDQVNHSSCVWLYYGVLCVIFHCSSSGSLVWK